MTSKGKHLREGERARDGGRGRPLRGEEWSGVDLKVVLVRVMSPIDASLTWILAGWLAGIIRASEEEQECKSATQSHRALKHIRIHVLQSRPLSIPLTYFLFGILAAVHFNLISDYQSSLLELKLTRFARKWLWLPI